MKLPPVYRYYLFFILSGARPKFEGMSYIMMKEVYMLTQVQIGIMILLGAVLLFLSIIMFQAFFKRFEMRTLMYYVATLMTVVSSLELFQVFRMNIEYGISDFQWILMGETVVLPLTMGCKVMPALVMFQKLAPENVEATMMSFGMMIFNGSGVLGKLTGIFISKNLVGVTNENV